jgi:hypothetical protein
LFANLGFWLRSTPQNVSNFGVSQFVPTSTLKGAAEWPYEASFNVIYRLSAGFEAFATLKNFTNRHYASVFGNNAYPGETFRGIVGLRFRN